jgi:hypothetical protein
MTLRMLARAAAIIAAATMIATAAHACDQRFPWTCKPVPSIEPAEAAETKASAKPLKITSRRATRTAKASSRTASARSAETRRAQLARKASVRRAVLRSRHAKAVAAAQAADDEPKAAVVTRKAARAEPAEGQPAIPRAPRAPRVADGSSEANSAFAMMWKDRTAVTVPPAEFSGPASADEAATQPVPTKPVPVVAPVPVPTNPVKVVAQDEVNEIDLAAANPEPADSSWLRNLFLAMGGLLALGSALRFLV